MSRIRFFCGSEQWSYISTEFNPADTVTRSFKTVAQLMATRTWISRKWIDNLNKYSPVEGVDDDIENRKKVGNMKTERSDPLEKVLSLTTRCTKFLYSNSLKRIITTYRS